MSESLVRANNWVVKETAVSNVKLPNGSVLTSCLSVKLKLYFDNSRLYDVVKFYVLPIKT